MPQEGHGNTWEANWDAKMGLLKHRKWYLRAGQALVLPLYLY